jgi:hypothetical protein
MSSAMIRFDVGERRRKLSRDGIVRRLSDTPSPGAPLLRLAPGQGAATPADSVPLLLLRADIHQARANNCVRRARVDAARRRPLRSVHLEGTCTSVPVFRCRSLSAGRADVQVRGSPWCRVGCFEPRT